MPAIGIDKDIYPEGIEDTNGAPEVSQVLNFLSALKWHLYCETTAYILGFQVVLSPWGNLLNMVMRYSNKLFLLWILFIFFIFGHGARVVFQKKTRFANCKVESATFEAEKSLHVDKGFKIWASHSIKMNPVHCIKSYSLESLKCYCFNL